MPLTCMFCLVGSASISAFPLFSGFISKSMIVSAAGHDKLIIVWLMLQFASAGVVDHAGIKVPYFMFFDHDSGIRAKEPPLNMLIAMGIAAGLCIFLGVYPYPLYEILPYPVDYIPYTGAHVVGQLQLLLFGALAFCLLILSGYYPAEMRAINLDTDWFYRKFSLRLYRFSDSFLNKINQACETVLTQKFTDNLAIWTKNGTARLLVLLMLPVWKAMKLSQDRQTQLSGRIDMLLRDGAVPIGISVAGAAILLSGLYFFH
jgi:multicomponent Na+:H+ antiporter subunit D